LMLSLGSLIRTLFFDLALLGDIWVATCDMSPIPRHNAFASAGGGDVGTLYVVSDVIDRICSHIGTSADGLYIIVSVIVLMYYFRLRSTSALTYFWITRSSFG
jgi:hypothetical protein